VHLWLFFFRAELDSSMAAATTGAYYSFWTVDKVRQPPSSVPALRGLIARPCILGQFEVSKLHAACHPAVLRWMNVNAALLMVSNVSKLCMQFGDGHIVVLADWRSEQRGRCSQRRLPREATRYVWVSSALQYLLPAPLACCTHLIPSAFNWHQQTSV
jgi:hypothetical protein